MIPVAHVGGPVFEPLQVALLTLVATAYAFRLMTLSQEGRPVPGWRVACFAGSLLVRPKEVFDAAGLEQPLLPAGVSGVVAPSGSPL